MQMCKHYINRRKQRSWCRRIKHTTPCLYHVLKATPELYTGAYHKTRNSQPKNNDHLP